MTTTIKKTTPSQKKSLEQEVLQKLETALESFKEILGEKKFKNRIKKAGKLMLKGKPKKIKAKKATPSPAAKKKTANKTV